MIVGVTKEVKDHEYRVGLTPAGVQELAAAGNTVLVETKAGVGSGLSDEEYEAAGAEMRSGASSVFAEAELVVKVKEPLPQEYGFLREDQAIFTYLHLAPNPELTRALLERRSTAIAYETVQPEDGHLPLLKPMSEVAGKMSVQVGARLLEKTRGGSGVLLGGVAGVEPGEVTILGGGVVGMNAAKVAHGLGADVLIIDINLDRLRSLEDLFHGHVHTLTPTRQSVAKAVTDADLLVGAVLVPGAKAPVLVTHEMLQAMRPGSVVVDVAIDQGGCVETSRPTSHSDPVYVEEDVIHYCVPNIPGAVSRTSTFALANATLPYVMALANKGIRQALEEDPALERGLNLHRGFVTCPAVAESRGGREDSLLKNAYDHIYVHGDMHNRATFFQRVLTSKQLKLKKKSANIAGLQLADLLAYPARQDVLVEHERIADPGDIFGTRLIQAVRMKYNRHLYEGRIEGYGKVLFPK